MNSFMSISINEAKKSGRDVPVGAVVVKNGDVIATAHNERELDNDVTSHAEILAIRKAEQVLGNWRLDDCDLYVTLEPCPMCGWAILQSRIKNVYFGSYDTNYGAFFSKVDLRKFSTFTPNVYGGIMEKECDELLNSFFTDLRK
ncbi:TPA: nucleoside deaminase [Candidatus Gastranaerophilales bacterium HUM_6]|nr:nucleoside deaminase [bacterium]CDE93441.1 zinc-binding CMP/dCMP deaminase [Fusobacterium sp. CAG:815]DAA92609.1 MAG TPA: nucleoside deaminase [Candidatus Gastranaerophilales bacterium HUM_6]DAA92733.1 MAG TPA: nucleoside deaminase [Candidatus Gastranaerophilales bacterium HUM_7]DAB00798.1 MAG TPA: nucleoside deaminase [Candidatus Gastranaerophilales bacterium HUM_12]DAB08845.1 MAG TPA: nucleoside deaminase [Candidatus Gastranaerophilales bacterium HUM_14]